MVLELDVELKDGRGMYQDRLCSIWKEAENTKSISILCDVKKSWWNSVERLQLVDGFKCVATTQGYQGKPVFDDKNKTNRNFLRVHQNNLKICLLIRSGSGKVSIESFILELKQINDSKRSTVIEIEVLVEFTWLKWIKSPWFQH